MTEHAMSAVQCPRCRAHVVSDVATVTDTDTGLHIVVRAAVATHTHTCGCGATFRIASTQPASHHPGQLTLIRGAA